MPCGHVGVRETAVQRKTVPLGSCCLITEYWLWQQLDFFKCYYYTSNSGSIKIGFMTLFIDFFTRTYEVFFATCIRYANFRGSELGDQFFAVFYFTLRFINTRYKIIPRQLTTVRFQGATVRFWTREWRPGLNTSMVIKRPVSNPKRPP
jgi:hypothetical protein